MDTNNEKIYLKVKEYGLKEIATYLNSPTNEEKLKAEFNSMTGLREGKCNEYYNRFKNELQEQIISTQELRKNNTISIIILGLLVLFTGCNNLCPSKPEQHAAVENICFLIVRKVVPEMYGGGDFINHEAIKHDYSCLTKVYTIDVRISFKDGVGQVPYWTRGILTYDMDNEEYDYKPIEISQTLQDRIERNNRAKNSIEDNPIIPADNSEQLIDPARDENGEIIHP